MALSGNYSNSYSGYTVRTEWWANQNAEENYSDLIIELYLDIKVYYSLHINSRTHIINIAGTNYYINSGNISSGSGKIRIGRVEKRIYHNSDGTLDVYLSTTFDMRATIDGSYVSTINGGFDTITLDKIPRMSTVSDKMDGTRELGTSHTIHIQKNISGDVTHTVWYVIRGEKGESNWYYIARNSSDLELTFTPTVEHIDLQPNSSTIFMDIGIDTFKDGVKFGTTTYNTGWYMQVPTTAVPVISNIDVSEAVEKVKKLGVFVQGHSKLKFLITRSGYKGSEIKQTKIEVDNQSIYGYNSTSDVIKSSGDVTIKVIVTDSRNKIATLTKTIRVEPYSLPSILNFDGYRLSQDETTVTLNRNFVMSSLAGKNTCSWKTERKPVGGNTWTTIHTGTNNVLNSNATTSNVSLDSEYEFRLTISDFNTSISKNFYVYTSFSLLDFHSGGKGIAIGRSSTLADVFDVDIKTNFRKEVEFQKNVKKSILTANLQNGWTPYDSNQKVTFYKNLQGQVFIQGAIKGGNGAGQGIFFTLPDGYRPQKHVYFVIFIGNYEIGGVRIDPNGNVTYTKGNSGSWVCLDGITFFTE